MKKSIIAFVLILALGLFFVSCSNKAGNSQVQQNQPKVNQPTGNAGLSPGTDNATAVTSQVVNDTVVDPNSSVELGSLI